MIRVDIRKQLGQIDLDCRFESGESHSVVVLFGRSGSGKSSIINAISGLLKPDSGEITVAGEPLFSSARNIDLPPERRRLGYVFQEGRLFPHLDVRRNLLYGARRAGNGSLSFDMAVSILGLEPLLSRRPLALSGGEKQRVAIGRALMANPRLILMDEPLANLDGGRKADILAVIERLRDEARIPIVYVSHAMEEVARLADVMVLVDDGKVAAVGPVEELTSRLDLRPLTGRYEAGSVLAAEVSEIDPVHDLARLSFRGGDMLVPAGGLRPGMGLKLRIRARDVAISLSEPQDISILNRLRGTVTEIAPVADSRGGGDGATVDILLDIGAPLWARITRKSRDMLSLEPGKEVHALIKTVAIDRASLGRPNLCRETAGNG